MERAGHGCVVVISVLPILQNEMLEEDPRETVKMDDDGSMLGSLSECCGRKLE